jgi:hypothetical protein
VVDQIAVIINFDYVRKAKPEGEQVDVYRERNIVASGSEDNVKGTGSANTAIESAPLKKISRNKRMRLRREGDEIHEKHFLMKIR